MDIIKDMAVINTFDNYDNGKNHYCGGKMADCILILHSNYLTPSGFPNWEQACVLQAILTRYQVTLDSLHPNTLDTNLACFFLVKSPRFSDAMEEVLHALSTCPEVSSVYLKPDDECP